jgi:molecular chaperone GrpE
MDGIVGKEFSPHEHEAMMMEEDEKFDSETVLAELQKGYYLHDRVLRTAKVKVGKPL